MYFQELYLELNDLPMDFQGLYLDLQELHLESDVLRLAFQDLNLELQELHLYEELEFHKLYLKLQELHIDFQQKKSHGIPGHSSRVL